MNGSINTGISQEAPIEIKPPPKNSFLTQIWAMVPQKVKDVINRFYANKKIFWPVTVVFSLLFLVVIAGLLFGSKGPVTPGKRPTPTPFVQTSPESSPSGDILSVTESQLIDLNNQINALDLQQNKLKPPAINYNISF